MTLALAITCLLAAAIPAVMLWRNWREFCTAPATVDGRPPQVSVLIPARNEAKGIESTLESVLASRGVRLEVLVWDDASMDDTAARVAKIAAQDSRLRLLHGGGPPSGWCGKQFACWQLAGAASSEEFVFLDADVQLAPDALARGVALRRAQDVGLLSGFPRETTGSIGESLLIPLIHYLLLSFLPFHRMRQTNSPAVSAGCGQLFFADRTAYFAAGGHAAIAASLHDGIELPRSFRRQGRTTDLFDAGDVAECRMYRSFGEAWSGLAKNAAEGAGRSDLIVPITIFLFLGQIAPICVAIAVLLTEASLAARGTALTAAALSYVPRCLLAWRLGQTFSSAALHPLGVFLFLVIQWEGLLRRKFGSGPEWKGRCYGAAPVGSGVQT